MQSPFFLVLIIGIPLFLLILLARSIFAPKKLQSLTSLMNQKRYDQAIKAAKKMISKESHNCTAHYLLGKAYLSLDNYDMALIEYRTVNNIANFDNICTEPQFRKEIAQLFIRFGQTEEALKEYLLLIKLEPLNADHLYNAGLLFEQRDRAKNAVGYYRKAIELNNRHSDSHFRLGYILHRDKKTLEAKAELEAALRFDASNHQAHFYMGRIKKDAHDYSGALSHFEQAMKSPELKLKAIVERGTCYLSMSNYDKAISELSRATKLAEDDSTTEILYARYFLAMSYENTRNIEAAVEQWEKIYAKKPSFRNVAEKLSQYQELRLDDRVKDYLTSNRESFQKICESIINTMKLQIREAEDIPNGCQIIAVESESKWRNARKMPRLVRFYRMPEPIKDSTVRTLHEDMKKMNVTRGIVFTSSSYSKFAFDYAQSRPIDLYDKDKLREFLVKASRKEGSKA